MLKFYRQRLELTQDEAAEMLGVSKYTLFRWEHSNTHPDKNKLVDIKRVYKLNNHEFLSLFHEESA